MPMDLRAWNQKLEAHFSELARIRKDTPVFALEHDLTPTEIQELSEGVRAHICRSYPLHDHMLVWIVYATEIGYGYAGDEYWQTFEEQTPGCDSSLAGLASGRFRRLPKEVCGGQANRAVGKAVLDHRLAHHTRDPPTRSATTPRPSSLRFSIQVLSRTLRRTTTPGGPHRGPELANLRTLPELRTGTGARRPDRRRAPSSGEGRLQPVAPLDDTPTYR